MLTALLSQGHTKRLLAAEMVLNKQVNTSAGWDLCGRCRAGRRFSHAFMQCRLRWCQNQASTATLSSSPHT